MSSTQTFSPPYESESRGYARIDDLKPFHLEEETYVDRDNADLVESIEEHGFREGESVTICPDGTILIGHRRTDAAEQHGMDRVPVNVIDVDPDSPEALSIFLSSNQHRDKTSGERINEGLAWERFERERAQKRVSSGGTQSFAGGEKGETREKVAERIDMSRESFRKGKKVKELAEDGDPIAQKAWEQLEKGDESIHGAYTTVQDALSSEGDEESEPDDAIDADEDALDEGDESENEESVGEVVHTQPGPGQEPEEEPENPDEPTETEEGNSDETDEEEELEPHPLDGSDNGGLSDRERGLLDKVDELNEQIVEQEITIEQLEHEAEKSEDNSDEEGSASVKVLRSRLNEAHGRVEERDELLKEVIAAFRNQDPEALEGAVDRAEELIDDA